ncbi:MAG: lipid IV(A) 3-deoxy-D-manno-octulosonic acid transferase [Pseudomonadota bacterium]|nr:lipid IV(A) 3-deoxy-D-manno-octulosonic acid transferase [Pseudomonadota bacterium]
MRLRLYRILTTLAMPLIAYSGWKRCKKHQSQCLTDADIPAIPNCFKSRFGFNPARFKQNGIWIHAVSVGETRSIFPLLTKLKQQYPYTPITITNGSTQGAIQALKFAPVEVQHQMIPYDFSFAINRFLNQIQPKLVIMVETEIWPNLYQACSQQNIPIVLANARLKEKSFHAYQKWGGIMISNALKQTTFIASQFPIDTQRFIELGTDKDKIKTLGNLKFDMHIDPQIGADAKSWKANNHLNSHFIWVAASTHAAPQGKQSEESLILKAHQQLLKTHPNALLILVPRHADRFNEVAELLNNSGLNWVQHSLKQSIQHNTQVYLADSVGEMMLWFECANIAFIGGSLVPFGGHNILEPAALHKPVISGPHYDNLQALYNTFIKESALTLIKDTNSLTKVLKQFAGSEQYQKQQGQKAYHCYQQQSGALDKLMQEIKPFLN